LKIILGIGHPADVHLFKNFIQEMKNQGHEVFVAAREKEITYFLLDKFDIPYHRISSHQKTVFKKNIDFFIRWFRTFKLCKRIKPDIAIGVGDFYLPQIGKLAGFSTIVITARMWNNASSSVRDRVETGFDIPIQNTSHLISLAE